MRYVALLRGVNVGGNNPLSMQALKAELVAQGFEKVETYINSGNILFSTDEADEAALSARVKALILDSFGVETPVAILTDEEYIDALRHAPDWWNHNPEEKHNAIFVIAPLTAEQACQAVGESKPGLERIAHYGDVIFWSASLKMFSRTRWSKVHGLPIYANITIRNANTARKLLALAEKGLPR